MFYFFALPFIYICVHIIALSKGLTSDMFIDGENDLRMMSCKNMCGTTRSPPCTCDIRCVLHNNCCEDFAEECPQLLVQGMIAFNYLENSSIICDSQLGVSVVASCPSENDQSENTFPQQMSSPHRASAEMSGLNKSEKSEEVENFNRMLSLFMEIIPVYDVLSGLVYLNSRIHECNTRGRNTQQVYWQVEIKTDVSPDLTSFSEINAIFHANRSVNFISPPNYADDLKGSACLNQIIDTCPPSFTDVEISRKCGEYFSYVKAFTRGRVFKNHYCVQCNGIEPYRLRPLYDISMAKVNFRLSILLNIAESKLDLQLIDSKGGNEMLPPFKRCTLDYESVDPDFPCAENFCAGVSVLSSEGVCKIYFTMGLALGEDGIALTLNEQKGLPSFVRCFLNEHFKNDIHIDKENKPQTPAYYDSIMQTVMYDMMFNKVSSEKPTANPEDLAIFNGLNSVAKLFYFYRLKRYHYKGIQGPRYIDTDNLQSKNETNSKVLMKHLLPELYLIHFHTTHNKQIRLSQLNISVPGDTLLSNNISVCSCYPSKNTMIKSCGEMVCWQTPITQDDLQELAEQAFSPCFRFFDGSRANSIASLLSLSLILTCAHFLVFGALYLTTEIDVVSMTRPD